MLIIEIILTIFAWRKGWKWRSLIPIGIALGIGLLMGIAVGASGGDADAARGLGVILDIGAIIALIVMVSKAPASKDINVPKGE